MPTVEGAPGGPGHRHGGGGAARPRQPPAITAHTSHHVVQPAHTSHIHHRAYIPHIHHTYISAHTYPHIHCVHIHGSNLPSRGKLSLSPSSLVSSLSIVLLLILFVYLLSSGLLLPPAEPRRIPSRRGSARLPCSTPLANSAQGDFPPEPAKTARKEAPIYLTDVNTPENIMG